MEDDDEFGDLYTDVLPPLTASFSAPNQVTGAPSAAGNAPSSSYSRRIDLNINSDDEEILYGAPELKNSELNSNGRLNRDDPFQGKTLPEQGIKRELQEFDLNLDSNSDELAGSGRGRGLEFGARVLEKVEGVKLPPPKASNFLDDDDNSIDILVEERDNKDDDMFGKDNNFIIDSKDIKYNSASQKENNFMGESNTGSEPIIPGISGTLENRKDSNFEDDWESEDSEDDLQIVLNDNHGQVGMEMMPGLGNDEDGEQLVIVAENGDVGYHQHNQQMMMNEQEWVGEEGGPGVDGERKELGDAMKPAGTASQAAVQPKMAYSGHAYHPPFHSQFKYVRPGAAPMPGPAPGPIPGQVRAPFPMNPLAGRGRGDWRPPGIRGDMPMQKPGYGVPVWGVNSAGRGYGSGLDFTLPSHKTIFEVDIDSFEEKSWKLPGIDISDFFNFGLNEESWKDYRKQLEHLRLGTTMQNKIRVYESGRAEQDYDPDLPPELAAAVAIQDIPSESAIPRNGDAIPTESERRQPLPIGRPIPVEIFSGDRLPSVDTRRQRMHDADCIIEVFCQSSQDDDDLAEQKSIDVSGEDLEGGDEIDDLQQGYTEHSNHISPAFNGRKREFGSKRAYFKNSVSNYEIVREDQSPEVPVQRQPDDDEIDVPHDARSTKGRGRVGSPGMTTTNNKRKEKLVDDRDEESFDNEKSKQSPLSSSHAIGSDEEQIVIDGDESNDKSDDRSFDNESEEKAIDETTKDPLEDVNSMHSTKKQKMSSHVKQLSQENDDREDLKQVRSSGNSKARSGSSKDHRRVEDEVIQDKRPPRAGNAKRPGGDEDYAHRKGRQERDEIGRKHLSVKRREDSHSHGGVNHNPSVRHLKSENEHGEEIGSRNRGKVRESERTVKEQHRQSRNQLDNGSWRPGNNLHDMGSRLRDRDDSLKSRTEKVDDLQTKKRKEGANGDVFHNHRESSSRRKKERDGVPVQWRRDDELHYVGQNDEGLFQKERNDRMRERDEWHRRKEGREEILSRREREETRPVMRSEEKVWNISSSRRNDEYRGSSKEYLPKDVGRRNDQLKERDRVENESFSQHRGHEDPYARVSHDEKRARYERPANRNERVPHASDNSRVHENKQKESSRRGKESESVDRNSLVPSKRNLDEHGSQISQTVNLRGGRTELEKGETEIHANRHSSKKHKPDASSDDEQQPDSRKGRSKLERWTSNKERDFSTTVVSSASLRSKDLDTGFHTEPSKMEEDKKPQPSVVDDKETVVEITNVNPKGTDDKHLDTVAKLKKRSERFKLPMPSEKEVTAVKKIEAEPLPSVQTEIPPAPEIKPERPARKRRWTGN